MVALQTELFASEAAGPSGFAYRTELIAPAEERALLEQLEHLPFKEFEFHGFTGKRRVVSFGWRYDFNQGGLKQAEEIPEFLLPTREHAARFAGINAADLAHALVTEYRPGAAIGWHRDRSVFGDVIGISLLSPCVFRLRRQARRGWDRYSVTALPRSVYLLRGPSRTEWEHSIPAVESLRYSITFRAFAQRRPA